MTTQDEIAQLLAEDEISTETAVRLILKSQSKMQGDITKIAAVGEYQEKYPSITYLFANHRRDTMIVATIIFLAYYALLLPLTISDLRYAIAASIGVPLP